MQIDTVINFINEKPSFKILAFLVLSFPTFQNYGQLQNILLALVTPDHICDVQKLGHTSSVSNDQCFISYNGSLKRCQKWIFSLEPVGKTMVSDYNLVCDRKGFGDVTMIIWYLTSMTAPFVGILSDKYGRKKVTLACLLLETVSSIFLAFSPTVFSNMVIRFLLGISSCGMTIAYVWLMESVNVRFRNFIGSFFWMFGCIAYIVSPLNTLMTKNWRVTQLVSIVPSVLYIFIFFVPESPRWLLASGQRKEAFESIKKIALFNNIRIRFKKEDILILEDFKDRDFSGALRSSTFMYRAGMAVLLQFANSLFYSAVAINLTILSRDIFLSMFLLGLMETPSLFLSFFSLRHFRRKTALLVFGGVGSTLFWLSTFLSTDDYWQSVLRLVIGCVAKTAISCVNQTTMVYIVELFPTSHRSLGLVCSQFFNFLSFIGAIYINKLSGSYFCLPMTIYVLIMAVACSLAYYTLPETWGVPFPENLQEQAMLVRDKEADFVKYMRHKYQSDDAPLSFEEDDYTAVEGASLLTNRFARVNGSGSVITA